MTSAEGITLLNSFCNAAGTSTRWALNEKNLALEWANREVWRRGVRRDPSRWTNEAAWTWAANAFSYDLTMTGQLGVDFTAIKRVYETESSGAPSGAVNVSRVIHRAHSEAFFDALLGGQQGAIGGLYYYHLDGKTMEIAPIITSAKFIRVRYLPKPPNLSAQAGALPITSNLLLSPIVAAPTVWFEEHHEYVVLRAAARLYAKTGGMNADLRQLLAEAEAAFDEEFAEDRASEPDYIEDPYGADSEGWAG